MRIVERGGGPLPVRPARWWLVVGLWLLVTAVYAAFVPHFVLYASPPTGDQPFYMMDAASIAQDGDLNVKNQYDNADYDKFYKLAPHPEDFVGMSAPYPPGRQLAPSPSRPEDEQYSAHLPGLGLLIAPGWFVGGLFDLWWPGTILIMCAIGGLVATNIALLAYEVSGRVWIAIVVCAALAFCNPIGSYSYLLFTELPTGLLFIYAMRRLALGWAANGPLRLLLIGVCMGAIPWVAWRAGPLSAGLALYAVWQWWRSRPVGARLARPSDLFVIFWPAVLSAALLVGFTYFKTGQPLPSLSSSEVGRADTFYWPWAGLDSLVKFSTALVGSGFDETFGLFTYAPVYLLALPGAFFMAASRQWRLLLAAGLLISLPYLLAVLAYEGWFGVWCPPARYLTTLVPLAAAPLAYALKSASGVAGWLYRLLFALVALPGWGFQLLFLKDARLMWPDDKDKVFDWLTLEHESPFYGHDLRPYLPSFVLPNEMTQAFASLLVITIALGVVVAGLALLRLGPRALRALSMARARRPVPLLRATFPALVGLLALSGAWYAATYPYLNKQTVLVEQHRWRLNDAFGLKPVVHFGGIDYAGGKVYLTVHDAPGLGVWSLDTANGVGTQVWAGGTHPADVAASAGGRLWVLDNMNEPADSGAALQLSSLISLTVSGDVAQEAATLSLGRASTHAMSLGVGSDGTALVADPALGAVSRFNAGDPGPVWVWNGPAGTGLDNPNFLWLDDMRHELYVIESSGILHQALLGAANTVPTAGRDFTLDCLPRGMTGDPVSGLVFVSCGAGTPQHIYSINPASGEVRFSRTQPPEQWSDPYSMAFGDGHLFVLDANPGNPLLVEYTVQP